MVRKKSLFLLGRVLLICSCYIPLQKCQTLEAARPTAKELWTACAFHVPIYAKTAKTRSTSYLLIWVHIFLWRCRPSRPSFLCNSSDLCSSKHLKWRQKTERVNRLALFTSSCYIVALCWVDNNCAKRWKIKRLMSVGYSLQTGGKMNAQQKCNSRPKPLSLQWIAKINQN